MIIEKAEGYIKKIRLTVNVEKTKIIRFRKDEERKKIVK